MTENLSYDVLVNDPPPQDNGLLPNGEPKGGSPVASTLIYGTEDAVLTDPARTVLWAGASALYGVRERPGEDVAQILVAGWL
jgi:hypothetical protein